MRRMSFALTTAQVRARTKTVTRRFGWQCARPGMLLAACERTMGFRRGEKAPPPIAVIRVVSTRWEPLSAVTDEDVALEGFPGRTAGWFLAFLCGHSGKLPRAVVNRIEFTYEEDTAP